MTPDESVDVAELILFSGSRRGHGGLLPTSGGRLVPTLRDHSSIAFERMLAGLRSS